MTRRAARVALAAAAAAALAGIAAHAAEPPDCARPAPGERRIVGPDLDIAWRPAAAPIVVGAPFSIDFAICPRGAATVPAAAPSVDAWMPAHRHGMNYRPSVTGTPPGPMRADGLLFHMPGRWQVVFELRGAERPLRLVDDLTVK